MQQTVMLHALATGLRLLGDIAPFISEAEDTEEAGPALDAIDEIMPTLQSIMDVLDEPESLTEAEAQAIAEMMTQHVVDWNSREIAQPERAS